MMSKLKGSVDGDGTFILTRSYFYHDSEDMEELEKIMNDPGVSARMEYIGDRADVTYPPNW